MKPKPYVSVTLEGPDDGGDFGRNTPGTRTGGIQEALDYAHAHSRDVWIWGGRGGVHDGVGSSHNIYTLEETLRVPWSQDFRLDGGNYLLSYTGESGHAIHFDSQMNCRYKFGLVSSRLPGRGGGDPAGDPRPRRLHLRHRLGLRLRLRRLQPPPGDRHPARLVARPHRQQQAVRRGDEHARHRPPPQRRQRQRPQPRQQHRRDPLRKPVPRDRGLRRPAPRRPGVGQDPAQPALPLLPRPAGGALRRGDAPLRHRGGLRRRQTLSAR